jgi:hypothetical protein
MDRRALEQASRLVLLGSATLSAVLALAATTLAAAAVAAVPPNEEAHPATPHLG